LGADDTSSAYLKELFLSSMVRWIATARPGGMDELVAAQAATLRERMSSMAETLAEEFLGTAAFEKERDPSQRTSKKGARFGAP
jgi:hypothetical protein